MRKTQYVGIAVLVLVVAFAIYKVKGQSFGSFNHDQPYLVGPAPTTTNVLPAGLTWHWVSSDLPENGPVTNWVDRYQSYHWTNVLASCPTNYGTNGVYFTGGQFLYMTNSENVFTSSFSQCFIFKSDPISYPPVYRTLLSDLTIATLDIQMANYKLTWDAVYDFSGGPISFNVWQDYVYTFTSGHGWNYTNGVYTTVTNQLGSTGWKIIGADLTSGANWPFNGRVAEVLVFNHPLSASEVSDFHTYRVNTYGN